MLSIANDVVLTSPVGIEWIAPTDPAINRVIVELARQDAPGWLEFELNKDAAGIDEPVFLSAGPWAADLVFAAKYEYKNSDFVKIRCLKYTETGYSFTVEP